MLRKFDPGGGSAWALQRHSFCKCDGFGEMTGGTFVFVL